MIVLAGAVVYEYGYQGVRAELNEIENAMSVKSKTLKNYVALIADKPRIEAQLAALKEGRKEDNAKMIEGQTAPLAAATLQSTVKEIITSRGGSISSERVEKPEDVGNFKMVTVTIDAIVPDIRSLSDTLHVHRDTDSLSCHQGNGCQNQKSQRTEGSDHKTESFGADGRQVIK